MLAGAMMMGILAALGLTGFAIDGDDDDDKAGNSPAAPDPDDFQEIDQPGDAPADDGGTDYIAGGVPGTTVIDTFLPGSDTLHLRVPGDASELTLTDAEGGATISYTSFDDTMTLRFDGLDSVPVDDIAVLIDGDGDPIPLAEIVGVGEVAPDDTLLPDDPGAPSDPGAPDNPDDEVILPGDPEAPSDPGAPDGGEGEAILPGDPSLPSAPPVDADLAGLMQRDGADPTGQTDQPEDITVTGGGDDTVLLPQDGADGTGTGAVALSEAAAVTGGAVVDLGDGADTLVAGDDAVHVFAGSGDDSLTAGDGGGALYGGDGADVLIGDAGAGGTDLLHGGAGDDTITGGDGGEYLDGGEHAELAGATGDDVIDGGGGNDTIRGGWGADSLSGGDGDDVIDHRGTDETRIIEEEWHHDWAEDGAADSLDGGAGDDTLILASGDIATGGDGADLFWVYPEDAGADPAILTDFTPGEDFLRITLDTAMDGAVELALSEDGADTLVMIGGQVAAVLEGTTGVTDADLYIDVRPDIFP